jgi:hypothetical protein
MFFDPCFFAEKLLVDLDLLSRSKMGHLHNFLTYNLVNAIPKELPGRFKRNLAIMLLEPCFSAEKLLVDLDLLSGSL